MIENLKQRSLPSDCFVFKHSTRCPISSGAAEEVRGHDWSLPLYWINVVEQRDLSSWIQEAYGTRHESPQLLFIQDGKVASVLNHHSIQRSNFNKFSNAGSSS